MFQTSNIITSSTLALRKKNIALGKVNTQIFTLITLQENFTMQTSVELEHHEPVDQTFTRSKFAPQTHDPVFAGCLHTPDST
jgi:hypothetical protein